MHHGKWSAAVVLVSAAMALATSAHAAEANVHSCIATAKDVRAALDAGKTSPNYEAAMSQRNQGLLACNAGFYDRGVAHYAVALHLLAADARAQAKN